MTLTKIFLMILLFVTICASEQNAAHILHGLFSTGSETASVINYGAFNVDDKKFTLINSLKIDEVGNPVLNRFFTPFAYDPNTDVIYMSCPNKQNHT